MTSSVIDLTVIDELRQLQSETEPGLIRDLVEAFRGVADNELARIERALGPEPDAPTIWKAAHTLKSSAANLGALGMSQLCREIEELGRQGLTHGLAAKFAELRIMYQQALTELTRLL